MTDREKVIKGLEYLSEWLFQQYQVVYDGDASNYYDAYKTVDEALALLKEQEIMSPDEFKEKILGMFSSIWDCEIDHPVFQDKVGELMDAVVALYRKAVKWQ